MFVFGAVLGVVGRLALEAGQAAHTKFVRTFDNTTLKKVQSGWADRLKSYNEIVSSSLESTMFAWYDTANFIRDSWASRQDEAGYGNSTDSDPEDVMNVENYATMGGEKGYKKLETTRINYRDDETLGLLAHSDNKTFESPSTVISPIHKSSSPLSPPKRGHERGKSSNHTNKRGGGSNGTTFDAAGIFDFFIWWGHLAIVKKGCPRVTPPQ